METPVSEQWIEAASISDFKDLDRKQIDLGDNKLVGLFKLSDGTFAAISIWCSHQKTSLMAGSMDDDEIMCPLHGARFDLRTGKNLSLPAVRPIESYEVKVENDRILIKV